MKLSKTLLAAAVGGLFMVGSSAQANVVIDLFDEPVGSEQAVSTETLGGTDFSEDGAFPTTSVIGGWRDMYIMKDADSSGNPDSGAATATAGFGVLSIDNATGVESTTEITWDGNDASSAVDVDGLGADGAGIDLTAMNSDRFIADIISADLGFSYQIIVWSDGGTEMSTLSAGVQFAVDPGDNISADFLYDWFNLADGDHFIDGLDFNIVGTGNVDFTDISALQLRLFNTGTAAADFSLGAIETNVPAPGGLALLGAGLVAAGAARRRKQSA